MSNVSYYELLPQFCPSVYLVLLIIQILVGRISRASLPTKLWKPSITQLLISVAFMSVFQAEKNQRHPGFCWIISISELRILKLLGNVERAYMKFKKILYAFRFFSRWRCRDDQKAFRFQKEILQFLMVIYFAANSDTLSRATIQKPYA